MVRTAALPAPGPPCDPSARGNATSNVPDEFGTLPAQLVEGRYIHAQEQAVPHGANSGGALAPGEHADLADDFPGSDLRKQSLANLAGLGGIDPGLQPAPGQQVERVALVALAERQSPRDTSAVEDLQDHAGTVWSGPAKWRLTASSSDCRADEGRVGRIPARGCRGARTPPRTGSAGIEAEPPSCHS